VPGLKLIGEVNDGFEAIDYLEGKDEYSDRSRFPVPDVLLLDLKMPRIDGLEVLRWLQTRTSKPRTIVLSGSDLMKDVQAAMALGADEFRVKPNTAAQMVQMLQSVLAQAQSHLGPQRSPASSA
jgi:CheY-like chemotaxis protein